MSSDLSQETAGGEATLAPNPFVGANPYRAIDKPRFFGREELSSRLSEAVLGSRCVTVYGPQGAGKTSLLRASVLPALVESQDVREVHIDAWPEGEDPTERLANAMRSALLSGPNDDDENLTPSEAVVGAAKRATRGSSRLTILCLDQIEQLIYVDRPSAETETFLICLEDLLELPLRSVRVILSLREDYLGRFLEVLRGRLRILEQYFRVVPFNVGELTDIVCKIAATGLPPQTWTREELLPLIMDVRAHGQLPTPRAEARLAYAQGFSKALFERRAPSETLEGSAVKRALAPYLDRTVVDLEIDDVALLGAESSEGEK